MKANPMVRPRAALLFVCLAGGIVTAGHATAAPDAKPPTPAAPAPGRGSKVSINADGVLVIDGRKIFPIGFTMPPPPDGKTPAGRDAIGELRSAGANFLRTGVMGGDMRHGGAGTAWDEAGIELELRYQDAAARHGMYCMVGLRELGGLPDGEEGAKREAALRRVIARFKDHPGMGVWKGVDEPEWGKHPVPPLVRARRLIQELDPDHPVWINHAPRGTVESLRAYAPACDVTGADIYPVGYPPGTHSLLPNREISLVGDHTRMMMDVAERKMPVWMVLQIAWSGVIKPGKTLRFPTFPEQRFMTYQAIITGARGLVYFGGHIGKASTPEDAQRGWNWAFWNKVLRPVVAEIGDHSPLQPALVAPDSKLAVKAEGKGAEAVELRVREVGKDLFILACKREGPTANVRFSGLPPDAGEGEVLFESPRKVQATDGTFTDWFGPFEVHVYRFTRG
jgi:hypothetical protein